MRLISGVISCSKKCIKINKQLATTLYRRNLLCTSSTSLNVTGQSGSADHEQEDNELLVTFHNKICTITFNRPDKKNAFTPTMFKSFLMGLHAGNDDENTSLVVVTGSGSYFTSGIDLNFKKPSANANITSEEVKQSSKPKSRPPFIQLFVSALLNVKKPLIALVNGPAVGFGVTMLGLFDSVYASDDATFHTKFTQFGLPPELCSTTTFPSIMGNARATHILLFNQKVTAQEAYNYGLVSQVWPSSSFQEESTKKLAEMTQLPVKSLIYTKELVRGRYIELYKSVSETEQSYFDPAIASEIKKLYMKSKLEK